MDLFYQDLKELMNEKGRYILCPCCLSFASDDGFILIEPLESYHKLGVSEDGEVVLGKSELFTKEAPHQLFHADGCGNSMNLDLIDIEDIGEVLIVFLPERKKLIIGQDAKTAYDEETINKVKKAARKAGILNDLVEVLE